MACLLGSELAGNSGGIPGVSELLSLDGLQEGGGTSGSWDGDLELGKRESSEWEEDSWVVLTINENTALVGDIDNNNLLSIVSSVVNESNSTWFNKSSITLYTKVNVSI